MLHKLIQSHAHAFSIAYVNGPLSVFIPPSIQMFHMAVDQYCNTKRLRRYLVMKLSEVFSLKLVYYVSMSYSELKATPPHMVYLHLGCLQCTRKFIKLVTCILSQHSKVTRVLCLFRQVIRQ